MAKLSREIALPLAVVGAIAGAFGAGYLARRMQERDSLNSSVAADIAADIFTTYDAPDPKAVTTHIATQLSEMRGVRVTGFVHTFVRRAALAEPTLGLTPKNSPQQTNGYHPPIFHPLGETTVVTSPSTASERQTVIHALLSMPSTSY